MPSPEQNIHILEGLFGRGKKKEEEGASRRGPERPRKGGPERERRAETLAREAQALMANAQTPDDYRLVTAKLQQLERIYSRDVVAEQAEAREILGSDFFGTEEVKQVFGVELTEEIIPEIPYSKEDLEKAKALGEMLVLRVAFDSENNPLTMKRIGVILAEKIRRDGKGKLFFDTEWYKDEQFFTMDSPKTEWKLVSKTVVPETTGKNYVDQTRSFRDYLATYGFATEEELKECTDAKLEEIKGVMGSDWKKAAEMLAGLKINMNHRRWPVEALYDMVLALQARDMRLQDGKYEWTPRLTSDGNLVRLGSFVSGGLYVNRTIAG